MSHEDIKELFRLCDTNNSGFIERSELKSIVPGADSATLENLLKELDCDGDGRISFQELADGLHKLTGDSTEAALDGYGDSEEYVKDEEKGMDNRLSWSCGNLASGRPRLENTYSLSAEDEPFDAYRKNSTLDLFGTLNSHSEAYLVHQHLAQQDAEMLGKFETFLREAVQQIKDHSAAKEELEQAFTLEQRKQQERLDALEEEAEIMNKKIELKTAQQLESKHEEDRLKYEDEICILQENLERMKQLQHDTSEQARLKLNSTKSRLHQMEQELQRLANEKREAETNALMATSQLATFKQAMKQQSFDQKEEWMLEYMSEQENLKKQIEHLQDMNKRLHDANQDLNGELLTMKAKENMEPKRSKLLPQQIQEGQMTPEQRLPGEDEKANFSSVSLFDELKQVGLTTPDLLPDVTSTETPSDLLQPGSTDEGHGCTGAQKIENTEPQKYKTETLSQTRGLHRMSQETTEESKISQNKKHETKRQNSFKSRRPLSSQFSFVEVTPERMFKVIFAGDSGVGKTSVILHLCRGVFQASVSSTLGIDFYTKNVQIDDTNISLQLWDTAGQERFRCISTSYFRKTDGVILLYDCCSERSFINVREWVATIRQASDSEDLPIMICANKIDLRREKEEAGCKVITTAMGEELASQCKAMFSELSAKTGEKMNICLEKLAKAMKEREDLGIEQYDATLQVDMCSKDQESLPDKCCS